MNDHEFDRIFRDRLYAQSYRPRQQVWKQLRLQWRNRIAARQWRWFCSAAVVVVVGVAAVMASTNRGTPSATALAKASGIKDARSHVSAMVRTGSTAGAGTPWVTGPIDKAGSQDKTGPKGMRHGVGYTQRHDGTRRGKDTGGATNAGQREDWDSTDRAGRDLGTMDRLMVPVPQRVQLPQPGRSQQRIRVPQRAHLPQLAQVGSRGAVQLAAGAKAAYVSLPERHKKEAAPLWNGWSGEVYGSPDIPTKQFNLSWTAGFRVSRIFATHYSITTGLQYSTANVHRGDWSSLVLYPPRFNNLDLPILLGYSTSGRRIQLSAYAGGIINLYSHATGHPGYPWPNHNTPSGYLGLDLSYRLDERWALFAQPYGRYLFESGSKSLIQTGTITEGALLGLRYRFNP